MNTRILLLVICVAVLTSCSTMYKSGQTPDDVYYSPGKERAAYVSTDENRNRNNDVDYTDVSSRYLRMKSANRSRWSTFDDDYLYWNDYRWNNPYTFNSLHGTGYMGYGYSYGYGHMGYGGYGGYSSFYSNPWFWNNPFGYNYYGSPVIIINPKPVYRNPVANGPRTYNLNTYSAAGRKGYNPEYTGRQYNSTYSGSNAPVRVFSNTASAGNTGGRSGRYINTNSGNSNRNSNYRSGTNDSRNSNPVRTFDNNSGSSNRSSGGSSSGSSSGGSAPVRSFPRGN